MIIADGLLPSLYTALNATGASDIVFWTSTQLYEWMDEAIQRICRAATIMAERSTQTTSSGEPVYPLPARYLSMAHVSVDGTSIGVSSVPEMEALDADWENTSGAVNTYLLDMIGTANLRLYRRPTGAQTLGTAYRTYPSTIQAGSTVVLPAVVGDALHFNVLAGARGNEGQAGMPEVAKVCREVAGLYEKMFAAYFGGAQ